MIGNATELGNFIREHTGLILSSGAEFGRGQEEFLRMNIACPKNRLKDGLWRLQKGIKDYEDWVVR